MPSFGEHVKQSQENLKFLERINSFDTEQWDWQITVGFYAALHLINAHIVEKTGNHYRTHIQVDEAINPFKVISLAKLPNDEYLAYKKLSGLSRRARYLCHEDSTMASEACFTYEKHFTKAVRYLDKIIAFFCKEYHQPLPTLQIRCDIKASNELQHITILH